VYQDLKSRKNGRRVCSACLSSRTIINIITRASAETGVEMLTAPAAARGRRAWASVGRPRRARDREREQREIAFVLPCALAGGPGALSKCSYRHIALPSKAVHLKLIFPLSNASHRRSRWPRRCPCPVWTLRVCVRIETQETVMLCTNDAGRMQESQVERRAHLLECLAASRTETSVAGSITPPRLDRTGLLTHMLASWGADFDFGMSGGSLSAGRLVASA
jgi:hypothetical protein